MPGVDLDITYPLATDPLSEAIPAIITALQTIETDVEAKIVPSEIDMTADLDMSGQAILSAGTVHLEESPDTDFPTGTAVFFEGEWYLSTDAGVVQVTLNGDLNAAAIGGIVGNYGGANPAAVTFVDASSVYRFTEDTGDWADLEAEDLILHGSAAGALTFTTDLTSNKTVTVGDNTVPASNVSALTIDSNGDLSATAAITNDVTITDADLVLTGTADVQHPDRTLTLSALQFQNYVSAILDSSPTLPVAVVAPSSQHMWAVVPWVAGDRIKSITVSYKGATAGDDFTLNVYTVGAGEATVIDPSPILHSDIGSVGWGSTTTDLTDTTLVAGNALLIDIVAAQASTQFGNVRIVYDRP